MAQMTGCGVVWVVLRLWSRGLSSLELMLCSVYEGNHALQEFRVVRNERENRDEKVFKWVLLLDFLFVIRDGTRREEKDGREDFFMGFLYLYCLHGFI